jgi:hypothetical protein
MKDKPMLDFYKIQACFDSAAYTKGAFGAQNTMNSLAHTASSSAGCGAAIWRNCG